MGMMMNACGGLVARVARPECPELNPGRFSVFFADGSEFCLPPVEYTPKPGDTVLITRRLARWPDTGEISALPCWVQINDAPAIPITWADRWPDAIPLDGEED